MDDRLAVSYRNAIRALHRLWTSCVTFLSVAARAIAKFLGLVVRIIAIPCAMGTSGVAAYTLVAFLPSLFQYSWLDGISLLERISPVLVPASIQDPASLATNVYLGVAAFGGTVMLATLKDLANSIPNYWDFVNKPSLRALLQPCALTFVAFLGLSMSLFAVAKASGEKPNLHLRFVGSGIPYDSPIDDALLRFYVVFVKEAGLQTTNTEDDPSIAVDQFFGPLLDRLVLDLASCIESPDDRVELKVRGFASSSEWTRIEKETSPEWVDRNLRPLLGTRGVQTLPEAFNLWAADRRASNVVKALNSIKNKVDDWKRSRLIVEPDPQTVGQMAERVRFTDVSPRSGFSRERALLTRRADVRLIQAGDCARASVSDESRPKALQPTSGVPQ